MVPSPLERSGSIAGNKLPYSLSDGDGFDVNEINPELPEKFSIRVVVNGINGKEANFPDDNQKAIWQNEGKELILSYYMSTPNRFILTSNSSLTIDSLDVYIDGVKMILT